jgi:hypothetical protein
MKFAPGNTIYLERVQTFCMPSNQQNYLSDYVNCRKNFITNILIDFHLYIPRNAQKTYFFAKISFSYNHL